MRGGCLAALDAGTGFVATNVFPLAEEGLYLELGGSLRNI